MGISIQPSFNLSFHKSMVVHGGVSDEIQGVSNLIHEVEGQVLSQVRRPWIVRTSVLRVVGTIDAWHTVKRVPELIH